MKQGASSHKRRLTPQRRLTWTGLVTILGLLFNLFPQLAGAPMPTASAHNLQTRMVYMFFDPATQACIDARMEGTTPPAGCNSLPPDWQAGDPVLLAGDELGVIIKVVPRDGTTTGVGGHIDFYVPNGVEVVDVGYMVPDGAGGFDKVAMKGQSPIAIGAGPIGAKATSQLIGLNDVYASTVSGISTTAVNPATGLHLGTIAGVYGDTGIFYATDPDTAYGSWQRSTGDSTANGCGSLAFNPTALGKTLVNNSGDTVVPCNKWDAEQLMAWGVKGGTFGVSAPIVDYADGRGNAPWGFASGVGGPQSGYAWNFDWDEWQSSTKDPAAMRRAMDNGEIGPWQRIRYDGDRISYDQPGLISSVVGYASVDAGNLGIPVANLPPTESQTDFASPKAIRWAVGQLTAYRPEYAWVKVAVTDATAGITNASGCPDLRGDTFGGDAGGTDGGKDHLWRYYEPTEVKMNLCVAAGKPATEELVKSGDLFQYPVKIYNLQDFTLTDVVVKDTLGSGLAFVSAFPAPTTTALPVLTWNVGTLLPGQKFESLVTVKATSSGFLDNCVVITAKDEFGQALPPQSACDTTISGLYPYLVPSKTVRSPSVAPGGAVIYDVLVRNIGEGATGSPVTVSEFLPTGFTYDTSFAPIVHVNGALVTPTVNTTVPANPVFSVPSAIQGGKSLTISFQAKVDPAAEPGSYCNSYSVTQNGVPITTGSAACVNVAGGKIGDTIWRDWDGDGTQDAGEEGIEGVRVYSDANNNGVWDTGEPYDLTDADGHYYLPGLMPGAYLIKVDTTTLPANHTQTGDPDQTGACTSCDNAHSVTLSENQQYLLADFGYRPTGTASIGDTVFEDVGNDGVFNAGTDSGIANVTVWLYEDTDGDGAITPGVDAVVATTASDANGYYAFTGLAEGYDYLVKVDAGDGDIQTYFNTLYNPDPVPYQLSTAAFTASPDLSGSDLDNDFGFWRTMPASIGDQVFIDTDGDRLYDPAVDTPLAGITVTLYRDGVYFAETISSPDGSYLFDNLGPGNYRVEVDTSDEDLPGGLFATVTQYSVSLAAGAHYLAADFPFVTALTKTVDKPYAEAGATLSFSLKPYYPGSDLLENVRVIDPLPAGTTYVASTANAGGTYGAYTPLPAVPGSDPEGGPEANVALNTTLTASSSFVNTGGSVNVTLNVRSSVAVINVFPTPLSASVSAFSCTGPSPLTASVPAGTTGVNFTWSCTLTGVGEYVISAGAEDATGVYSWPEASSASVLSAPAGGTNVVTWSLGSHAPGVPGEALTSGYTAGVYGFRGANTKEFSKYATSSSTWTSKAGTTNGIEKGGSLTGDGAGTLYGLEGNSKIFYKYDIATNAWSTLASTSDNANEGGAVQYLQVGANEYVYALLGNSNRFRQYNVGSLSWTTLASTPENVKKGGALTTDGTYLYALRGDRKPDFWRYNVVDPDGTGPLTANSWTARAPVPANVGWGGSLASVGNYIYAMTGDGKRTFYRYDIAGNSWSAMALTPGNVGDGGALTTDGTYIYAFQGKTTAFWRYNIAANSWSTLAAVNFTGAVGQGGALVYDPGVTPEGLFTSLVASPSLVPAGDQITVVLQLQSTATVNDVSPTSLTVTPTGGASCSALSGPLLLSADDDIQNSSDAVRYQWKCTVAATTTPSSLRFSAAGTGGAVTFPTATSRSVLVSPVLTFQATVNNPPPSSGTIDNTGLLVKAGPEPNTFPSNTTETATAGSIGDYVWADLDGDGVQDGDESGLAGVKVYIDSDNDGMWDEGEPYDITDATGRYRIYNLLAGDYIVTYDFSTAPVGYLPTTDTRLAVMLDGGEQYDAADFGLKPAATGSIGDRVWLDENNDGVQDAGETGLPGIHVTLEIWDGAGWVAVDSTTTGSNGLYSFGGLIAGDYRVTVDGNSPVTSPHGPTSTLDVAMDPTYDRDGTGTAHTAVVTLATDTTAVDDVDFGYNWSGSIGDYVWWDANADGNQNDGAPATAGISGAAVLLYADANGDGVLDPFDDVQVGFAMTGANGAYTFANLPPGDYLVDVYEDSLTTDGLRDVVPTTENVIAVSLPAGQTVLTADFGYFQGARVEGNVFHDDDRNATFDAVETGLEGVTVTLTGPGPDGILGTADDVEVATTDTDSDGHFFFIVPKGDYALSYSTTQTDGLGYPEATTPTRVEFYAYPGEDWHPSFDFGVDYPGTIGDRVWNDVDGDGVQDDGEPGIGGVTLTLYHDTSGDGNFGAGDKFFAATATDATGAYLFTGLSNGTYFVIVDQNTLPDDYDQTGDPDQPGVTCTSCDNQGTAVVSGGDVLTVDFGYQPPETAHTVSGTIWNDADGSGVQDDGEPGISSVTVCLYDDDGVFVPTCTTTDADGHYAFPGVANGDYIVRVDPATLPSTAYTPTYDPTMPLDNQTPVTVDGANVAYQDFGYQELLGSISGTVCEGEGDGNGVCDPLTETGLSGVTVTLVYAGADGILGTTDDVSASTTTDANGDYSFDGTTIAPANCTHDAGAYASCPLDVGLLPGRYQIIETNPENYISLADADGGNPDNISLALALGQNAVDQDFEDLIVFAGFIGDLVWWDINEDGRQDAGEPGIPGVTVELLQGGEVIETTLTDASGLYSFTNLPDGAYTVRIWEEEFTTSDTPGSGTLENWTASPVDQTTGDLDSDGHPTTHDAAVEIGEGEGTADVDFGFSIVSSYDVTKVLSEDSENPSRLGQPITFTISIENTGKTWISILPLQDSYNSTYLTYGFGPNFATPDTVDHVNDGVLNWTDLTALAPYGWGTSEIDGDLAPGATQVVEISFTARSDTSALGPNGVANTVTVSNALADPDGPDGPLPPLAPLVPSEPASAYVQIYTPTGVVLEWFDAAMTGGAMLVNWRTASEAGVLGFNVLRRPAAEAVFTVANAELILAQYPGEERGAAYAFRDEGLLPGEYVYRLESIGLDGNAAIYGEVTVIVQ